MAYNVENLTKLKHLKELAQRVKGETDKLDQRVDSLSGKVDGLADAASGITDAMYQAPTPAKYRAAITPASSVTGSIVDAALVSVLGTDKLSALTSSGTDGEGSSQYDFVVNGVTTGTYTQNATLSDIMGDINSNGAAGVSISYSEEANQFTFTARKTGADSSIEIDGGLAEALFGPTDLTSQNGGKFAEVYGDVV